MVYLIVTDRLRFRSMDKMKNGFVYFVWEKDKPEFIQWIFDQTK